MNQPDISLAFAVPDGLWCYQFGTWTHHDRLEGETDEEGLARVQALMEQERPSHVLPYR
jgi:hypothetical protein